MNQKISASKDHVALTCAYWHVNRYYELDVFVPLPASGDCTVGDALLALSKAVGHLSLSQLQQKKVGVWNTLANHDTNVRAGDRLEVYEPIRIDPKEARRARVEKSRLDRETEQRTQAQRIKGKQRIPNRSVQ